MIELASSTTELTTTYSRAGQNPPVITFVGRPLDSAKALSNLLAALKIVHRFSDLPPFQTWLIGGGEDDIEKILSVVEKIPELMCLRSRGLLQCFGKVAYDALPEFYSRSTLLVVPSWFETFGRVAVEAMSCGCPVIAADTTGLKETVLHGMTGLLYPAADIASLSAILVDCLAFPRRASAWRSLCREWTGNAFSLDRQFASYMRLYQGEDRVHHPAFMTLDNPAGRFQDAVCSDFTSSIEALLTRSVSLLRWESHPHHLAAQVQGGHDRYIAIQYQIVGESAPAPHFLSQSNWCTRSPARRIRKVLKLLALDRSFAPQVHQDPERGMILFPEEFVNEFLENGEALLRSGGEGGISPLADAENEFKLALTEFAASPHPRTLAAVDAAGRALDISLEDGPGELRMRHPQVEMYRLLRYLDMRESLLDAGFVSMARCMLDIVADREILVPESLSLQRFDGVGPHHTGHLPLLLVLDECAFAAGPLSWALRQVKRLEDGANVRLLLTEPVPAPVDEAPLGLLWVVVSLIFRGISAAAEGHPQIQIQLNAFLEQITQMLMAGDLSLGTE